MVIATSVTAAVMVGVIAASVMAEAMAEDITAGHIIQAAFTRLPIMAQA